MTEPRCSCDAQIVPGANHVAPCALYDAEEDAAIQRDRANRLERRAAKLEAENKGLARDRELYLGLWHKAEQEMAEMREATDG